MRISARVDEAFEIFLAFGTLQIQGDLALVAAFHQVGDADALYIGPVRAHDAGRIAFRGSTLITSAPASAKKLAVTFPEKLA